MQDVGWQMRSYLIPGRNCFTFVRIAVPCTFLNRRKVEQTMAAVEGDSDPDMWSCEIFANRKKSLERTLVLPLSNFPTRSSADVINQTPKTHI